MANQNPSLIKFNADLKKFSEAVGATLADAVTYVTIGIHDELVFTTPVDTGRAAGSWGISLDSPSDFEQPASFNGGRAAAQAAAKEQQANLADLQRDPYREVWIVNNLPYIEPLNMGHSQQAPAGFVETVVANAELMAEDQIRAAEQQHGVAK